MSSKIMISIMGFHLIMPMDASLKRDACLIGDTVIAVFLLGPLVQENNLLSHHWISGQVLSYAQDKKKKTNKKTSQPHVEPSHSPFNTQISSFLLV